MSRKVSRDAVARGKNNLPDDRGALSLPPRLLRFPLFKGLSERELSAVLNEAHAVLKKYEPSSVAFSECDEARCLGVVVAGEMAVHMAGIHDGDRHLIQRLKPGGTFGTTLLSTDYKRYPAMLTSVTTCELLLLRLDAVRAWLQKARHPAFLANLFRATARDAYHAWRKLMLLSCYKISDRVLLYLRWRQEDGSLIPYRISYPELSEFLGVNRTALYRAVAELKRARRIVDRNGVLSLR